MYIYKVKVLSDKDIMTSISIWHYTLIKEYCHVPARWGLQQTTLAPGSDETRARDPKIEKHGPTTGPVLLWQGEPGTSQYVSLMIG